MTDQRSKARLQTIPNRLRLLETAFHFLPTTTRCRVTIGRSELLACFFAALLNFVPNPFDWLLLRRNSVSPSHGEISATTPLPSSQFSSFAWRLNLRSLLGFLGPFRSKR